MPEREHHLHAARLENSPRLQEVLAALSPRWRSTRNIAAVIQAAGGRWHAALHSDIAELRHPINGIEIETRMVCDHGARRWEYRLLRRERQEAFC